MPVPLRTYQIVRMAPQIRGSAWSHAVAKACNSRRGHLCRGVGASQNSPQLLFLLRSCSRPARFLCSCNFGSSRSTKSTRTSFGCGSTRIICRRWSRTRSALTLLSCPAGALRCSNSIPGFFTHLSWPASAAASRSLASAVGRAC